MEMAQRNKLNRKSYARLCRVFFWKAIFLAQIWRSNRFAGSNQQGRAAPWSSRGLWRKSFLVAASLTRLLGNGRLGSPKWNKQISLVNTCRRVVSQICRFFYLGVYNLYFTKLKSRVNLYRNGSGKRTLSLIYLISDRILCHDHATLRLKKKDFSRGFKYRRTPVTRTRKGNEKQFESQLDWVSENSSYRGRLQNSICHVKIDNYCEVNRANIFCRNITAEGSVTF